MALKLGNYLRLRSRALMLRVFTQERQQHGRCKHDEHARSDTTLQTLSRRIGKLVDSLCVYLCIAPARLSLAVRAMLRALYLELLLADCISCGGKVAEAKKVAGDVPAFGPHELRTTRACAFSLIFPACDIHSRSTSEALGMGYFLQRVFDLILIAHPAILLIATAYPALRGGFGTELLH